MTVSGLPAERHDWGSAMLAELDHLVGRWSRWRFAIGCTRAAALIRTRAAIASRESGGRALRIFVFTAIVAAVGLVAYGLAHYRGLRSGFGVWASVACFAVVLLVYGVVTLVGSRGVSSQVAAARRYGLAGGIAVGGSWLLVFSPTPAFKGLVAFPLVVALLGPACVAAMAARTSRDAATGTRAALWTGLVAGLGVFDVWVAATYARDGGPYDAGMLRDFHSSHAPDLATYAVSDNLGSALVLLLLIPTVALAVGSVTAHLAAGRPRSRGGNATRIPLER